jgi:hypothetical protein
VKATGARHSLSLMSAITSKGHMRFMIREKGDVNADFKKKVISAMRSLQKSPEKIRSFYQKASLKYAA